MFAKYTLSALSLIAATAAHGSDAEGKFAVRGIGGQPCSVWTSIAESTDEAARRDGILAFQAWIAGYLTASNRLKADTYDALPFLDMINVLAITINECKATPEELAENTVARVVGAFDKAKVTAESPIVTVPDAGADKPYRQATVKLAQQKLVDLGYLTAEPDGVLGPATSEALTLYQSENGLTSNGELSVDTMFQLLLK
jgi:hypothetical protein